MTLILELPAELERRLTLEAQRHGVTNAKLALQLLSQELVSPDYEVKKAAEYVLEKNEELYRRLADRGAGARAEVIVKCLAE